MLSRNERIEGKAQQQERLDRNERIDRKAQWLERFAPESAVELEGAFTNHVAGAIRASSPRERQQEIDKATEAYEDALDGVLYEILDEHLADEGPAVSDHHTMIEEGDREAAVGAFILAHEGHTRDVEVQSGAWTVYCRCTHCEDVRTYEVDNEAREQALGLPPWPESEEWSA
jgi:hypothetical protein